MKPPVRTFRLFHQLSDQQRRQDAADRELRRAEIDLLRRQVKISYANVFATIALSVALLTLTFCQWRTAESTAAIERAKARPHFRVKQTDRQERLGFLPRQFQVEPVAGVSDSVEATATSLMLIHYSSRELGINGICRARFSNFYGWTNDAMSHELTEAAEQILRLSQARDTEAESSISLQPLWVLVSVDYIDIFGQPGTQDIQIFGGQAQRLNRAAMAGAGWAGIDLNLQINTTDDVLVYRVSTEPASRDCVNALRVLERVPTVYIARSYAMPPDQSYIITTESTFVRDPRRPFSATYPSPTILPFTNEDANARSDERGIR